MQYLIPVVCGLLFASPLLAAQEGLDEGFGFDEPMEINIDTEEHRPDPLRLSLSYMAGAFTKTPGEQVVNRMDLRLQWEGRLSDHLYLLMDSKAILRGHNDQNLQPGEDYQWDSRLRELYLQGSGKHFGIKAGYQMVIWGEMDSLQLMDQLTPLDYSEFVYTAPEDARIGQFMVTTELYSPIGRWDLVINPDAAVSAYANDNLGLLLPVPAGTPFQLRIREPEAFKKQDMEYALRWKKSIPSSDLTLSWASLLSNDPLFEAVSTTPLIYEATYPRYRLAGISANYSREAFLWKGEMVYGFNRPIQALTVLHHDTADLALGFDYNANGAYTLSVEMVYQRILAQPADLGGLEKNSRTWVLRWSKSFFNETLSATYFVNLRHPSEDLTHSATLSYDISDTWRLEGNVTVFDIADPLSPLAITDDWDQYSLRLTAYF